MSSEIEVHPLIDLYDSEADRVVKTVQALAAGADRPRDQEQFRKEIIGRFEEIGLVVKTLWYTATVDGVTPLEGVYIPEIQIVGRCEPLKYGFDYQRQHHEVVNDVAGIEPEKKGVHFAVPDAPPEVPHSHHH